ncbi:MULTISPECIES: TonB-system energizer ExbB [Helicobacter]|uniref:Ferric siderophore transport system, biopolymer transport protein ExbB n=1 Tax=Helicobacter typhlonius TaxID=76936 RepID=A0A099UEI0_9HELI|nr:MULTISPECIES: TonB-system energizer ExbB [Helicobacter]TLD77803.1 TonB-system energizer ExbB [Helicobacter typhlonius]TLD88719.1 TonB-system energizer ExbB [Helicobacter sp. MIT 03-1616]CUU39616.1 Ferric siderophore transport system, biopolymer transport protein ExbB [Helicobacter typhlonius]HCD73796.1 TonB-system energizer ExbB [Helicobacter sp.]
MEFLKEYIDHIIFAILGLMSFLSVWFSCERLIFFAKLKLTDYQNEDALEESLSKNLTALYIIYSNAPYVGLLGTVIGIMITFYDMGMSGGMDAQSIMVGLSTALKATALGLVVAIPTLIVYNCFVRKMDIEISRYKRLNKQKD